MAQVGRIQIGFLLRIGQNITNALQKLVLGLLAAFGNHSSSCTNSPIVTSPTLFIHQFHSWRAKPNPRAMLSSFLSFIDHFSAYLRRGIQRIFLHLMPRGTGNLCSVLFPFTYYPLDYILRLTEYLYLDFAAAMPQAVGEASVSS